MNINKSCKLFLRDVQSYDISSCHYEIVKRLGYNLSKIPKDDKLKRNIQIGLMMKENPRLTNTLRSITESTISEYLVVNNIKEDDIIIRQYDGFITTKSLRETNLGLPLDLRPLITYMLISVDRNWYITIDVNNEVSIKGVPYRYEKIDKLYEKLIKINFASKREVFKSLQKIRDEIFYSRDSSLYCIPGGERKYTIFLKNYGEAEVSSTMVKVMDTDDIDKERYFDFYLRPFTESLSIEFL